MNGTRNRKVCHLTSVHARDDVRIFHKECVSLASHGFDVCLVVADGLGPEEKEGIRIRDAFERQANRAARIAQSYLRMWKVARDEDADVYHFHDPELIPVGIRLKAAGKTVVYDAHEDIPRDILTKNWIPPALRKLVALLFERYENSRVSCFDGVAVATPDIAQRLARHNERTVVIHNFPLSSEVRSQERRPRARKVCYVGFLSEVRGLLTVLDSLSHCDAELLLAGRSSDPLFEARLRNHRNWDRVEYRGHASRRDVSEILAESNVGLVPFLSAPHHLNALPTKMFEYMAAGLPVVASDFRRWRDLLEAHGCAAFIDPANPRALGAAIDDMLREPERAEQMGSRGKKAVESLFNWEAEERKLLDMYAGFERSGSPRQR